MRASVIRYNKIISKRKLFFAPHVEECAQGRSPNAQASVRGQCRKVFSERSRTLAHEVIASNPQGGLPQRIRTSSFCKLKTLLFTTKQILLLRSNYRYSALYSYSLWVIRQIVLPKLPHNGCQATSYRYSRFTHPLCLLDLQSPAF